MSLSACVLKRQDIPKTLCPLLLLASSLASGSLLAQPPEPESAADEAAEFKSGYGAIPDVGGPESVSHELRDDDAVRRGLLYSEAVEQRLVPYYSWKTRLNEGRGLSVGFSASLLTLWGSEGRNEDTAMGGIYRVYGRWGLLDRGNGNTGSLQFRLEKRSNVNGFIAPDQLDDEMGIAALDPGYGYKGSFGTDISVFNWTQMFAGGSAGVAAGRLSYNAYIDHYLLTSYTKAFHNRAFIMNPSIPSTGTGALGAVTEGYVSDRVWIGGGFFDANAVSGALNKDTFRVRELYKYAEVGWTPSFSQYKSDKIQFTYWDMDEHDNGSVPEGSGWALTASVLLQDIHLLFLRAGHSDGGGNAPAEDAISMGFSWRHRPDQVFSVGLGWAQPSEKTNGRKLRDEYVLETFYGLRLTQRISVLTDLQVIENPALNPQENRVWVIGLRARLGF